MDVVILKDGSCKSLVHLGVKESYGNAAPNSWTLGTLKFDRSFHKIPSSVAIK